MRGCNAVSTPSCSHLSRTLSDLPCAKTGTGYKQSQPTHVMHAINSRLEYGIAVYFHVSDVAPVLSDRCAVLPARSGPSVNLGL
jgi:hypothetical protein